MNFEPAGLLEDASGGPLNMAVPVHDAFPPSRAAKPKAGLSSLQSPVFDCHFRRSIGTDHGVENLIQVEQSWS